MMTPETIRHTAQALSVTPETIEALRRCSMTLHRWHELECGDGNNWASWCLERDEATGIPYMVTYPHTGKSRRSRVADRETSTLKRVKRICAEAGLYFYVQTDPRGCALFVGLEPLNDQNYSRAHALYK